MCVEPKHSGTYMKSAKDWFPKDQMIMAGAALQAI